ncbi:MAG: polyprenyl synthetase family protein [Deltaproteobacteria bacterium]|nr:polyprenyl synthetase family protein [Deltaproteobacteria bacterium]
MEKVLKLIQEDLQKVEEEVKNRFVSQVPLITTVAEDLISRGGKRFRPALLLLSARLCGYKGRDHIPLAVVIEFIHTATLLHDDVIDNAEVRRGSASANTLWGNEASVLVGDFLFSKSFAMMVEIGYLRILQTLASATTALAEGETMELVKTADLSITEEENLELIINKTAVLISAATRIGAILGKKPLEIEETMAHYGLQVGIAFQLVDDCLDYVGEKEALGKETGSDLKEGKITLPLIYALKKCTPEEKKEIQEIVLSDELPPDGLQRALSFIDKYNGIDYTFAKAQQYIDGGKEKLWSLPPSPERDALFEMADYVVRRRI